MKSPEFCVCGKHKPTTRTTSPKFVNAYAFVPAYFGPCCGIAQQTLFHWLRKMPPSRRTEIFARAHCIRIPDALAVLKKIRRLPLPEKSAC